MTIDEEKIRENLRAQDCFKESLLESVRNGFDIYKKIDGKTALDIVEERLPGEKEQNEFKKQLMDEHQQYLLHHKTFPRAVRPTQKEYE